MKRLFGGRKEEKKDAAPTPTGAALAPPAASKGKPMLASSPAIATSAGILARASSNLIPNFGFMSAQNSTGASAAIAELSEHIDILLTDWSSSGKEFREIGNARSLPIYFETDIWYLQMISVPDVASWKIRSTRRRRNLSIPGWIRNTTLRHGNSEFLAALAKAASGAE